MIYRSDLKRVEDYFNSSNVSQSGLKLLLLDPKRFSTKDDEPREEKRHFLLGSAVDLALTGMDGDFERIYYTDTLEAKPSDMIMLFCNSLYADYPGSDLDELRDAILNLCEENEYGKKWGEDTKYNRVVREGSPYWETLKASEGKTILSREEKMEVDAVIMSLKTHNNTATEFSDPGIFTDVIYQQPIYWEYLGVPCKSLLDMIVIDHNKKTITVKDIKTTGDHVMKFPTNVRKFRYDFQAAFYSMAVSRARDVIEAKIGRSTEGYVISDFDWIVESIKYPGLPLVFRATLDLIAIGKSGRQSETIGKLFSHRIYGVDDAIEKYKWHLHHGFNAPQEVMETGGRLTLDWNGIIERR